MAAGRHVWSAETEQTRYTLHVDGKPTDARIERDTEHQMGRAPSHSFATFVGETMIDFSETLQWAKYDLLTHLGHEATMPRHG